MRNVHIRSFFRCAKGGYLPTHGIGKGDSIDSQSIAFNTYLVGGWIGINLCFGISGVGVKSYTQQDVQAETLSGRRGEPVIGHQANVVSSNVGGVGSSGKEGREIAR